MTQWVNTKEIHEEGTIATQGQKFIWKNGSWMPHSKAWFKVDGNEKTVNKARKVKAEKAVKKAKTEMQNKLDAFTKVEVQEEGF